MERDDLPPPPAGMVRYVFEAGSFADPERAYQDEAWVPGGASALLDAISDEVAIECAPDMIEPAGMTSDDGTHLRIYEAATGRTVEWMILFPHREEPQGRDSAPERDRLMEA